MPYKLMYFNNQQARLAVPVAFGYYESTINLVNWIGFRLRWLEDTEMSKILSIYEVKIAILGIIQFNGHGYQNPLI